jgi:hypothetical protein
MELALAVLLAVALVALASTWSTLRTERERARRIETRLADAHPDPALPETPAVPP